MTLQATGDDEYQEEKKFLFFGVDLWGIECMKSSLMNGYCTAAAGGVGAYLFTSKWKILFRTIFASFWIGSYASWRVCRYKKYKREKARETWTQALGKVPNVSYNEYNIPSQVMQLNQQPDENTDVKQVKES